MRTRTVGSLCAFSFNDLRAGGQTLQPISGIIANEKTTKIGFGGFNVGVRSGRSLRRALPGLLLLLLLDSAGCGGKSHARRGHAAVEATPAPVPTPDNTPIDVLRTPSGMVLKLEEPTPVPGKETMPGLSTAPAKVTP